MIATPCEAAFQSQLHHWLRDRGCSRKEIDAILDLVDVYDDQTERDAFFAAVGTGSVDLVDVIAEALGGREVGQR